MTDILKKLNQVCIIYCLLHWMFLFFLLLLLWLVLMFSIFPHLVLCSGHFNYSMLLLCQSCIAYCLSLQFCSLIVLIYIFLYGFKYLDSLGLPCELVRVSLFGPAVTSFIILFHWDLNSTYNNLYVYDAAIYHLLICSLHRFKVKQHISNNINLNKVIVK